MRAILEHHLELAVVEERADLAKADDALRAALTAKGLAFNKPDPGPFRATLKAKGFYTQWQQTYGAEAWTALERYAGSLS